MRFHKGDPLEILNGIHLLENLSSGLNQRLHLIMRRTIGLTGYIFDCPVEIGLIPIVRCIKCNPAIS